MVDDLDDDFDDFDDGDFDDLNESENSLGDLWRNNPLVKVGIILFALAILVGGVMVFGGERENLPTSRVAGGSDINQAPGTAEVSEVYRQAVEEENVRQVENATRTGTSAIPMTIDPPKGTVNLNINEDQEEDPLERWRRMQEQRIREQQVQPQSATPAAPEVDTRTPAIESLAGAMSAQMQSVLGAQAVNLPKVSNVATLSYLERIEEAERQRLERQLAAAQTATDLPITGTDGLNILVPAGTIEYAQILTEVNTDAPGPVLAEIATGPLKGARAIGTFSATYNYLTLNFNTLVLDGVDFSASGVALDPDTTLPGVVTEIDRRYFSRIILPAAAEFVSGFAGALADSSQTTVTITGDSVTETTSNDDINTDEAVAAGIEEAGDQVADIVDEIAGQVRPMLRIAAGTPIGILFLSPVVGTPQLVQQREERERERLRFRSDDFFRGQ